MQDTCFDQVYMLFLQAYFADPVAAAQALGLDIGAPVDSASEPPTPAHAAAAAAAPAAGSTGPPIILAAPNTAAAAGAMPPPPPLATPVGAKRKRDPASPGSEGGEKSRSGRRPATSSRTGARRVLARELASLQVCCCFQLAP